MLFPEDLCNQTPGLCEFVIQEETPSPLLDSFPTDGLPKLTQQHCFVIALGYPLILLLPATGYTGLPGVSSCLVVPHHYHMETPLPEVHSLGDMCLDLFGPTDTQRLRNNKVGKDKRPLGVPTLSDYPPPFRCQDCREAAPYCSRGCGVPSIRLCS